MDPHWYVAMAAFARPFLALFVFGVLCLGGRYLVIWYVPEGKVKRILLWPIGRGQKTTTSRASRRQQLL